LTAGAPAAYGSAVPARGPHVERALAELRAAGASLLIDLEFTCWEDSLRTGWADPARPAEVIEIGLAAWDVATRTVRATFDVRVRPTVNPTLSPYCAALLHIAQSEIDAADELPVVLRALERWLGAVGPAELPTCGWGPLDRAGLARNARTVGAADPLAGRRHIDLRDVMTELGEHPHPIGRDELRQLARLPPNPRRHRALDDALDLTHFLALLLDSAASPQR
jgi:inhibitor of KinA sporulation pathway (predicted exonuclease)